MSPQRAEGLRTLLVGIDAACMNVLEPLFETGVLPTLRRLEEHGASGALRSQIPPWTASAWPSLYTGMNPGKHGIFDFLRFDGYDWTVVNASHVSERFVWELLDDQGFSSVVVNAPVTHPIRPFDGALVPGYVGPEEPTCHPEGLLDAIRDAIGEYRVYPTSHTSSPTERRGEYVNLTRMRGEAFRYLVDRFDPDFGFVQFQQTDTLFHEQPGDRETVRAVYAAVDDELGTIIEACDPDTVVVASDHGIGAYDGCEFRVNEFLRERGRASAISGGRGMPTWATVRDTQLKAGGDAAVPRRGLLERAAAAAARAGCTSQRLARALDRLGLGAFARRHVPATVASAASEHVDFPASEAYMRSRIECGVRINLEGREPDGVVPESEYDSLRWDLVESLASVTTPGGAPVFEDVAPRGAYFWGPHVDRAVDVVTVPAKFDHFLSARLPGETFGEPTEPWNHKRDGFVAMTGEAVDERKPIGDPHIFDVAPTILATFDLPAAARMDGHVLGPVEPAGEQAYPEFHPPEGRATGTTVVDRLIDLGYVE